MKKDHSHENGVKKPPQKANGIGRKNDRFLHPKFRPPKGIEIPNSKTVPIFTISFFWNHLQTKQFEIFTRKLRSVKTGAETLPVNTLRFRLDQYKILSPWRKARKKPYHEMRIGCLITDRTWVFRASKFKADDLIQCVHLYGWEIEPNSKSPTAL